MSASSADLTIRPATAADAAPLRAIRNHWIAASHASFDEQPLAPEAVRDWIAGFASTGPHRLLVAERAGVVVGFASSQPYRAHPAFRHTVETSIYVAAGAGRGGIGSRLYDALFAAIADEGLHRAVVGIALPNEASVRLHRRQGFREVGTFDEYAIKNGRFISSVWMQRTL
ncbi:MAG TPA: GNAT family N-acetyltransferase [Burkholderiaceae bacterium]